MKPVKILLFSADVSMTRAISSCLLEAGYKVALVSQGNGALYVIHTENPALLIFDHDLPGCKSIAIIRSLRSEESNGRLPVILMGANMREEDVLIGLEVGADLCLLEMFHPQVFVARVRSLLRRTGTLKPQ
jgi:DNA-binding response OmpR family regulator